MNNADLIEIRALLQANAASDRRRRPKPALGGFRFLLGASTAEPAAKPNRVGPPARRAGATPDLTAEDELVLTHPAPETASAFEVAPAESRRNAFGQRRDPAPTAAPRLQLFAPPETASQAPDEPAPRRLAALPSPMETPYLPGDLSDPSEADAERLYAASGLFEPRPPPAAPEPDVDPQRELLRHLERVFLAERAALAACEPGA